MVHGPLSVKSKATELLCWGGLSHKFQRAEVTCWCFSKRVSPAPRWSSPTEVPPPGPGTLTPADSLKESVSRSRSKVKRVQSSQIQGKNNNNNKKTIARWETRGERNKVVPTFLFQLLCLQWCHTETEGKQKVLHLFKNWCSQGGVCPSKTVWGIYPVRTVNFREY